MLALPASRAAECRNAARSRARRCRLAPAGKRRGARAEAGTEPGCLTDYPPNGPAFLAPSLAGLHSARGYERAFVTGDAYGAGRVSEYSYAAYPTEPNRTGVRSFAADGSGRVCVDAHGANLCEGPALPAGCTPVR
jgi:hypothetical protein